MKGTVRNPIFLIGFVFIIGLIIASFVYSEMTHNHVKYIRFIYDRKGKVIESSPLSPRWNIPLGTDRNGGDMLSKMLLGAKYTILTAFFVSLLRMAIAIPVGLLLGVYLGKYKKYVNGLVDSFHYIPLTILAYYILYPCLWEPKEGFHNSFAFRLAIEVGVLAILTVPVISIVVGNETGRLLEKEYVLSSHLLGASRLNLVRKHIIPGMREKLFVLFGQQMMQVLIILSHLGYLQLFLGGTHVSYTIINPDPPSTLTYEWSGLIGSTFRDLRLAAWVPLTPLLCFAATMLAVSMMIEGYVQVTTGHSHYFKAKKKRQNMKIGNKEVSADMFKFYKHISR